MISKKDKEKCSQGQEDFQTNQPINNYDIGYTPSLRFLFTQDVKQSTIYIITMVIEHLDIRKTMNSNITISNLVEVLILPVFRPLIVCFFGIIARVLLFL